MDGGCGDDDMTSPILVKLFDVPCMCRFDVLTPCTANYIVILRFARELQLKSIPI